MPLDPKQTDIALKQDNQTEHEEKVTSKPWPEKSENYTKKHPKTIHFHLFQTIDTPSRKPLPKAVGTRGAATDDHQAGCSERRFVGKVWVVMGGGKSWSFFLLIFILMWTGLIHFCL